MTSKSSRIDPDLVTLDRGFIRCLTCYTVPDTDREEVGPDERGVASDVSG